MDKVHDFADRAHGDQMRKYSDERYIVHPERVMHICKEHTDKVEVLAAALLHDVLEDTETSKEEIFDFISGIMGDGSAKKTLQLVEELTDVYEKRYYPKWNRDKRKRMEAERISTISAEAQTIKYADIIDNAREIVQQDPGFGKRFLKECGNLLDKMTKGNPTLRQQAIEVVKENLQQAS